MIHFPEGDSERKKLLFLDRDCGRSWVQNQGGLSMIVQLKWGEGKLRLLGFGLLGGGRKLRLLRFGLLGGGRKLR